jgi:hypothetical protein
MAASDAEKAMRQDRLQASEGTNEEQCAERSTDSELAPFLDKCNRERQGHRYDLQDASKSGRGKGKAQSSRITAAQFREKMRRPYTVDGVTYNDMDQQSFTYDSGTLYCMCCSTTVSYYHAAQHVMTDLHKKKLPYWREHGAEMLTLGQHVAAHKAEVGSEGQTLDAATLGHRAEVMQLAADCNWSVASLHIARPLFDLWSGKQLRDVNRLSDNVPVLLSRELEYVSDMNTLCFREWASTFDGSPLGCEAEVFMQRRVSLNFDIIELLSGLVLLKKSPNARAGICHCSSDMKP